MGHDGIKRGNVVKTKLAKSALEDFDASFFGGLVCGRGIDGLDDIVNLGRNKGIYRMLDCLCWRLRDGFLPGNSRRYNLSTLATTGISYFWSTSK